MTTNQTTRKPQLGVETLEDRLALSTYMANGMLVFEGTSGHDVGQLTISGGYAQAYLNGTTTAYSLNGLTSVGFWGYGGNDTFANYTTAPTTAYGGSGNDILLGGAGNDLLVGGDNDDLLNGYGGNDTLEGGYGNDALYGGTGNDNLYGQQNNDGLFGGVGTDNLYGGTGADRFLYASTTSYLRDKTSSDAVIRFENGTGTWTVKEIEIVDQAFKLLHNKTIRLLKDSNSAASELTFRKASSAVNWAGLNTTQSNGRHVIQIADWDEDNASRNAQRQATVIHEIGHNWDNENRYWNDFLKISGWTTKIPSGQGSNYFQAHTSPVTGQFSGWYYLKTKWAGFAGDYARTSPYEDFADSFESYFVGPATSNLATKYAFMNSWLPTIG